MQMANHVQCIVYEKSTCTYIDVRLDTYRIDQSVRAPSREVARRSGSGAQIQNRIPGAGEVIYMPI